MSSLAGAVEAIAPKLSTADRRVLEALLFAPYHSASAGQLRTLLGLKAVVQVNAAMGRIGRMVQDVLGAHPEGLLPGEYEWWHVIATGETQKGRGFIWRLREGAVAGLLSCGYSASCSVLTEEVVGPEKLVEGAVRQVTVNAYERNPVARARCIEAHGAECSVCAFNFAATYGAIAAGFVHVHHTRPLACIGTQYEVDPVNDLRPVCPNCHAVIHMTSPPLSIEEARSLLRENAAPNRSAPASASGRA